MNERTTVLVLDQARGVWGAQQYLLRLAAPLAERGVDLVLAAPRDLELAQAWTARGLPLVDIALPMARSVRVSGDGSRLSVRALLREAANMVRGARAIRQAARSIGADVIQANGHAVHLDAVLGGLISHRPVVLHLHEEMTQGFGRLLRSVAVAGATRTLAVSGAVAKALPARLRDRVVVIANGVDVEEFSPGEADPRTRESLGAAPDDVLLVALTRLDPEKRIEDLITGLAPLTGRPGWHLAVVGTTSSYDDYADQVRELGAELLGDRVTFTGRRSDVVEILRAADVLVHAGMVEGMPLGMIEAQACGRPVVAYGVAGVPEAVLDRVTGLLAPGGATTELGALMTAVVVDGKLRSQLGTAARSHAVESHSVEVQADHQARLVLGLGRHRGAGRRRPAVHADPTPRVLLVNHWHDDNRGDSAITQGILTLLRAVAPQSRVTVTTLSEDGPHWAASTRHLERFWPGLVALPSPYPTELRGRMAPRARSAIAGDAAIWYARLAPYLPSLLRLPGPSPWRRLLADHDLVIGVGGSNVFDDAGVPAALSLPRLATVLGPVQDAIGSGTPVLLVGHTLGPFSRSLGGTIARRFLHGVDRVVVREARSIDVAVGLGIQEVEEAPDLAFAIVPELSDRVEELLWSLPAAPSRTLVLSARQHPTLGAAADRRLVDVFAQAARSLIAAGAVDAVAIVAHTIGPTPVEDDRPISTRLAAALADVPVVLIDQDISPAELSAFYGAVAGVVAVRLHASILALNAGTPTFAVSYLTAKTQGVMTQVGLPGAVADFASVTVADVVDGMLVLLRDSDLRILLEKKASARRAELFGAASQWFAAVAGPRSHGLDHHDG